MAELPKEIPPDVAAALQGGNIIEAIKLLRQRNMGLAEARSLIEALQRQGAVKVKVKVDTHMKAAADRPAGPTSHPHAPPHVHAALPGTAPGLSPGEVPRASGAAVLIGVVAAIIAVIAAAAYFSG